jgi:uncharacterized protein (TIGR01732 family)
MAYAGAAGACGVGGGFTSTGVILVLFILLTIIGRSWLPSV